MAGRSPLSWNIEHGVLSVASDDGTRSSLRLSAAHLVRVQPDRSLTDTGEVTTYWTVTVVYAQNGVRVEFDTAEEAYVFADAIRGEMRHVLDDQPTG